MGGREGVRVANQQCANCSLERKIKKFFLESSFLKNLFLWKSKVNFLDEKNLKLLNI